MPRPDESEDGQPTAELRPVDGQSAAMTEEELVRAKLNEVSSSTAPEGWRPIGLALQMIADGIRPVARRAIAIVMPRRRGSQSQRL
jgi:hypothetical protein